VIHLNDGVSIKQINIETTMSRLLMLHCSVSSVELH